MLKADGLYGHINNNNLKSIGFLLSFALIAQTMAAAVICFVSIFMGGWTNFEGFTQLILQRSLAFSPLTLITTATWAGFAFRHYKSVIRDAVALQPVSRLKEPRIFNITERLAISVGLTQPTIEVSETPALGAFAMGLFPNASSIGVTRGLLNALNDQELEAVIAHEITHIQNLDVRLMTIATILCGIMFSVGWFLTYRAREFFRRIKTGSLQFGRLILGTLVFFVISINSGLASLNATAAANFGLMFGLIFIAVSLGQLVRLSISRKREFIADAGAIQLTQNPDAMISALCKISGRDLVVPADPMLQAMMFVGKSRGLFSTHPSLEDRIEHLVNYAAHNLIGYKLQLSSNNAFFFAEGQADDNNFSIKNMRYPAWVAQPKIIIPTLVVFLLCYCLIQFGIIGFIDKILQFQKLFHDFFYKVDLNGFQSLAPQTQTQSALNNSNLGFFNAFSMGDVKGTLLTMLYGLPLTIAARLLVRRGIGRSSPFLRKLAGLPSLEMESDWNQSDNVKSTRVGFNSSAPANTASPNKLNSAMDEAITKYHSKPQQLEAFSKPRLRSPSHGATPVFGKRMSRP